MLLLNLNKEAIETETPAPAPEPREPLIECFDVAHYRAQLTAASVAIPEGVDLIDFYKQTLEVRLFSPNDVFDENYYLSYYDDVRAAVRSGGMLSGFAHFVLHGAQEGRFPNKDFEIEIGNCVILGQLCREDEFEQDFYLTEYNVAKHFVKWFPIFTAYKFFTTYGRRMGHVPQRAQKISFESVHSDWLCTHSRRFQAEHVELIRPHFDANFYVRQYGDEIGGSPPFAHYLRRGQKEGKSPNAWFDEAFYRAFNADLAKEIPTTLSSGFEHYLRAGRREGRLPAFDLEFCIEKVYPGLTRPLLLSNVANLEQRLIPKAFRVVPDQPKTIWFMLPTINPDIFFGGYTAIIRLIEAYIGLGFDIGLFLSDDPSHSFEYFCFHRPASLLARHRNEIEVFSARNKELFKFGPNDFFVAYSAWQALWAHEYAAHTTCNTFAFLIQEYESMFHRHDSARFLVDMAYRLPCVSLFNSKILEDFFRSQRLGAFKDDVNSESFLTFEHVLTPTTLPSAREHRMRTARKFLLYARPEDHAARNLFEIGVIALRQAVASGVFPLGYEFVGAGALTGPQYVDLGLGKCLEILPKMNHTAYADVLRDTDVGLSLMYAAHPSLVPYEMADAGAIAVTNAFANRSVSNIEARSRRLIAVECSIQSIVEGLRRAVHLAEDTDLRTNPAYRISGPGSWEEVFNATFVDNLMRKFARYGRNRDVVPS
jgi:hypothetical protein